MTEPIKQEIINNIFENGDKLITGPILQTVLIDMIDDVNVKDQEILSKTGSWDEAATQIPNLATKVEVTNLSESVARDLENVDLTGYATEQWVQDQGYLKEHQDISNLATKTELTEAENNLQSNITSLSESVARDLENVDVDLTGYATEAWVQSQDYASKSYVNDAVASSSVDLTGYATETWVQNQGYLKEHQDISGLATKTELNSVSESIQTDISNLATKGELNSVSQSVQTDITNLSESVANSAVWKKGEGTDSIVQILTGDDEASTPVASGVGAVATGKKTTASGMNSHAEGFFTNASGNQSHAEGYFTKASGIYSHAEGEQTNPAGPYSHAEGFHTVTSNAYEHAQGKYNYTSSNQIFSVGAGGYESGSLTRRNAVSILAVPNADTKINTASVFVQNVGGYDGTNPEPGANDLATVINNLSSGGSSETLWKKGEGTDSIVQVVTEDSGKPRATTIGAVAIGYATTASGIYSHAEGWYANAEGAYSHAEGAYTSASNWYNHTEGAHTVALGDGSHAEGTYATASGIYSHAEGAHTVALGQASHAEGRSTIASNNYEHAQGRYNYTSSNQIFSVGTGNSDTDRRNAVSVLEVDNSGSYTSSFFVQNVGGYDGTNPEPGTNDLATVINGMSSGGGSSETLWKKGEGQDSIVQVLTGADEAYTPTATGKRAIAIGYHATASGDNSYAEGNSTASGSYSHAEGHGTLASGIASHAEGYYTTASNTSEHAQGRFNHNSENQIFSVGAGEWGDISTPQGNRRNALSVLAVPNPDTKINTASFFVQNIGGYDGTNPEPGTNDLATVINGMSSGGGSSETLWKKGEGKDSLVQVLTGDNETKTPTATGGGALALGFATTASGFCSHAEGDGAKASGNYSHAEGSYTNASGPMSHAEGKYTNATEWYSHVEGLYAKASASYSHAEGYWTIASNQYEHAQGRYNHNSENQIFSIGTGNSDTDRRNVVSVLEVSNNNSYTGSVFVQNVGGYDGTNPTPGTNDLATVINGMSTGGGSSETLWKKGEGVDSIVQVIADGTDQPTATGNRAIATGYATTASEQFSHAEGNDTAASGDSSHAEGAGTRAEGPFSHAEGYYTTASGEGSHAEGYQTVAPNSYECALGMCNHSSESQIFSVGAGEGDPFNPFDPKPITRRNAISVLAVPNSETQIVTSSFFVQNVGGYDGTNPEPGTNDLATVINNLPSGGTSSETWTFTLEDGSTVTKNIVMR